jgi:hypothetical protein
MTPLTRKLLAATLATSVLLPVTTIAAQPDGKKATASSKKKQTSKQRWRGYGFLPGYRQPPALTDWRLRSSRKRAAYYDRYEPRYLAYWPYTGYSQLQYGWGSPGVYRGRWNGGSFGPCWTSTPIGMMWNCGQ